MWVGVFFLLNVSQKITKSTHLFYGNGYLFPCSRLKLMVGCRASRSSLVIIALVWLSANCMAGTACCVRPAAPSAIELTPLIELSAWMIKLIV